MASCIVARPENEQLQNEQRQQVHTAVKAYSDATEKHKQATRKFIKKPDQLGAALILPQTADERVTLEKYAAALRVFTDSFISHQPPDAVTERT